MEWDQQRTVSMDLTFNSVYLCRARESADVVKKHNQTFHTLRYWRRPIAGALVAMLCIWLMAFATHLHISPDDLQSTSTHACEFCASPVIGAPSAATTFSHQFERAAPATVLREQISTAPLLALYQSRAPPAA